MKVFRVVAVKSAAVDPHGGLRRFRWERIPGCHVTEFAPQKALKLITWGKLTFDDRVVVHCLECSVLDLGGHTSRGFPDDKSTRLGMQPRIG